MSSLSTMERQATLLERPNPLLDIEELAEFEERRWKQGMAGLAKRQEPVAADDMFFVDSQAPFGQADFPAITLSTTSLMLWPTVIWTPTKGGNYWWVGKKRRLKASGKMTTAATPGNLTVEVRYGTTDNAGILLATSAAMTLIASQTSISWTCEVDIECRAVGASTNGSLFAMGTFEVGTAVIAVGQVLIPASAAVAAGVDTTNPAGINFQAKRSGSTAETMTVQQLSFQALN